MVSKMKFHFKKAGAFLLLMPVLFFAAASAHAQGKPDWSKPSSFGPTPVDTPSQSVTNKVNMKPLVDEDNPKVLSCGEQYEVNVSLTQPVESCEGFNFTNLYEQAKKLADARVDQIKCEDGECLGPYRWYGYWNWGCTGTSATAQVQEWVSCPNPGSSVSIGYGDGAKQIKKSPTAPVSLGGPPPKPPVTDGEYITAVSNTSANGFSIDCGSKFLVLYEYEDNTPSAAAVGGAGGGFTKVKSFEFYYKLAEENAKLYHDGFKCKAAAGGGKCDLTPFKVDYATWTNNPGASTVTVDIYFYVECVAKK
jgi:hypothetical protein